MAFIRQYGMAGDPGPRPAPKRKSAGAGPKMKANRKRQVRKNRAMRGHQGAPKGPGKKQRGPKFDFGAMIGKGADIAQKFIPGGAIADALGMHLSDLGKLIPGSQDAAAAAAAAGISLPDMNKAIKGAKGGKGGHGRRKNPANVKALRRSLSRVEGFGRLVKRVNQMLPRAHHFPVHPVLKHKRRRKSA